MEILITGAGGFLGKRLVHQLVDKRTNLARELWFTSDDNFEQIILSYMA